MGVEYITHTWKKETDVAGTNLLMLLALSDYADERGGSFAGVAKLGAKIRKSESTARSTLKKLAHAHKIVIQYNEGYKTKNGNTNRYTVVAVGINCDSYEHLCKKLAVEPLEYTPLNKDKRGDKKGDNLKKVDENAPLLDLEGVLNSVGQGVLDLVGNPSVQPSVSTRKKRRVTPPPVARVDFKDGIKQELFTLVCKYSFEKTPAQLGAGVARAKKIVNTLVKLYPPLTPHMLKQGYIIYADECGHLSPVTTPEKILVYVQKHLDGQKVKELNPDDLF